jgi:hypothetical protein
MWPATVMFEFHEPVNCVAGRLLPEATGWPRSPFSWQRELDLPEAERVAVAGKSNTHPVTIAIPQGVDRRSTWRACPNRVEFPTDMMNYAVRTPQENIRAFMRQDGDQGNK